jgi:hypothetical protein
MFNVQYILLKKIDKKIQLSTQLPAKLSRLASPTTCCFYKEQQQKDQEEEEPTPQDARTRR